MPDSTTTKSWETPYWVDMPSRGGGKMVMHISFFSAAERNAWLEARARRTDLPLVTQWGGPEDATDNG